MWQQLLAKQKVWFGFPTLLKLVCPSVCYFTSGVPKGVLSLVTKFITGLKNKRDLDIGSE